MSIVLVLCIAIFVLCFAGLWILLRAISLAIGAVTWTAKTAIGIATPKHPIERCVNDRCNAPWRDGARFCPRCGQPRRVAAALPAPTPGDLALAHRPARAMTRVA